MSRPLIGPHNPARAVIGWARRVCLQRPGAGFSLAESGEGSECGDCDRSYLDIALWHLETCTAELRQIHKSNSHQGELQIRVLEDEAGQDSVCVSGECVCSMRGLLCDAGAWVGWMGWQFYKACKNILDIVFDVWIRRGWRINKTVALCSVLCSRS